MSTERRFNPHIEGRNYPEFSRDDIEAFYSGFVEFDIDGNGTLDQQEFAKALKFMGQSCSPDQLSERFRKVDTNGSGTIEWSEFLAVMSSFYESRRKAVLEYYYTIAKDFLHFTKKDIEAFITAFHEFDTDSSGSLNVAELEQCFKFMGLDFKKDKVHALLQEMDVDGSGCIEWPEFLPLMTAIYSGHRQDFEHQFYEPAKKYPEFSHDDIDSMILVFREFDEDGSGELDGRELGNVFKYMGQPCNEKQMEKIKQKYGDVDWREFLGIMHSFYAGIFDDTLSKPAQPFKQVTPPATPQTGAKPNSRPPPKDNSHPAKYGTITRSNTAALRAKFEALSKKQ